jgi:hypothetical protein
MRSRMIQLPNGPWEVLQAAILFLLMKVLPAAVVYLQMGGKPVDRPQYIHCTHTYRHGNFSRSGFSYVVLTEAHHEISIAFLFLVLKKQSSETTRGYIEQHGSAQVGLRASGTLLDRLQCDVVNHRAAAAKRGAANLNQGGVLSRNEAKRDGGPSRERRGVVKEVRGGCA